MRLTNIGDRRGGDAGSTLFLFPAGLLIVLLLGAVAVDLGNVWLQQRRLADAADSAANDAVTYGIDQQQYRIDGRVVLDAGRVGDVVAVSIAGQELPATVFVDPPVIGVAADGSPVVSVHLTSSADFIFGRLIGPRGLTIEATGRAVLDDGVP